MFLTHATTLLEGRDREEKRERREDGRNNESRTCLASCHTEST